MFSDSRLRFRLLALGLLLFLTGLVMAPQMGLSAERIHWVLLQGAYEPDLDIVSEDDGAPGSAFFLFGEGYPPNTPATIYVDGQPRCAIVTSGAGTADFIIQTYAEDPLGRYDITLATDANTSDTDDVRLEDDEPVINAPPGWDGLFCDLFGPPLPPTPLVGQVEATPAAEVTATPGEVEPTATVPATEAVEEVEATPAAQDGEAENGSICGAAMVLPLLLLVPAGLRLRGRKQG